MKALFGGNKSPYLFAVLFFLFACQPDGLDPANVNAEESYQGVDQRLWSYFADFEEEGRNRGFNIDIRARFITGEIREIEQEHVAGQCQFNFRAPNHIIIDEEFWEEVPSVNFREMIIFHELGHCYLGQDHREEVLDRNICASIMRSGNEPCFDNYTSATREYYLDELFNFDASGN